ncbi:MAG TPA: SAM-dependent methyltransferase [Firmicutes bacterium]|nr:SAM-dependent methyltransferase [Bacillota bacterium]
MKETIIEMEKYAKEYNVPIIEQDNIKFIRKYIKLNGVKNILELGTAIGYSGILMVTADEGIHLTTIERDEKKYMEALKNIKKCGLESQVEVVFQDALDVNIVGRSYDLIFIDAAKGQYIKFFEKFCHYLSPKGVIISDNINFHGLVGHKTDDMSKNLRGLVTKLEDYIEFLKTNREFTTKFYDIGDGLSVSYRNVE